MSEKGKEEKRQQEQLKIYAELLKETSYHSEELADMEIDIILEVAGDDRKVSYYTFLKIIDIAYDLKH